MRNRWIQVVVRAGRQWVDDDVFSHSSAVGFNTLFSLAPITAIAAVIAGMVMGKAKASAALQYQLTQLMGADSARMIAETSAKAAEASTTSKLPAVISVAVLLFGATTVFGQLQSALNDIWKVEAAPDRSGWLAFLIRRLLSFTMVLSVGFLLLVSLILTTVIEAATNHFGTGLSHAALRISDIFISGFVITALFALLLKVMPDVSLKWPEVCRGGLVSALLFTIGRYAISAYLAHSTVASVYGAAGSLVALLIWIYYSAAIFFYGAEFIKAERVVSGQGQPEKIAPRK